jgi:hypothetical protein
MNPKVRDRKRGSSCPLSAIHGDLGTRADCIARAEWGRDERRECGWTRKAAAELEG